MTTKQILVFLSVTLEHVSFVSKAEERNMFHSCLRAKKYKLQLQTYRMKSTAT